MPLRMMMLMTRRRRRNGGFHMQHYCKALVAKLRIAPAQHSRHNPIRVTVRRTCTRQNASQSERAQILCARVRDRWCHYRKNPDGVEQL